MHIRESFRVFLPLFALVATAATAAPATALADPVSLLVPSYFYPGTGGPGGAGDGWAAMTTAASQVSLTAIVNPDSGPGPSPDPNYASAMTSLENAGGKVVAYVFTGSGTTPIATVESQISTYISQYGSLINGFFLDGMYLGPSTLAYYQTLDAYIKSLSPSYTVIGNPGQPYLNGLTPQQYLSTADIFNIFEGPNQAPSPGAPGFDAYPYGVNWFQSEPSSRFSNTIYDVPADAGNPNQSAAMLADLSRAAQLNAGSVYITDQSMPNPYAQLPSYWDQEVAAISVLPEPGSGSLLIGGALLAAGGVAARRRGTREHPGPGRHRWLAGLFRPFSLWLSAARRYPGARSGLNAAGGSCC